MLVKMCNERHNKPPIQGKAIIKPLNDNGIFSGGLHGLYKPLWWGGQGGCWGTEWAGQMCRAPGAAWKGPFLGAETPGLGPLIPSASVPSPCCPGGWVHMHPGVPAGLRGGH